MANPYSCEITSLDHSTPGNVFPGSLRRCLPGFLLFTFCIFGSPIGQAQEQQATGQQDQSQQTQDQDVAKAAREERARKQVNPSTPRHVYTAEDLKRDQILTPEDRAMFEAGRRQWTPLVTQPPQDALDAQSLSPDVPLGDIARSLQRQKELMKLRRSSEFHLPLPEAPVLAAPKPSMEPLRAPLVVIEPPRPKVVGQFHPPVKRSPFERPRVLAPEFAAPRAISPALPQSRVSPAAPFTANPSAPRLSTKKPSAAVAAPEMPHAVAAAPIASEMSPAAPKAPRNLNAGKPRPSAKTPGAVLSAPVLSTPTPASAVPPVSPAAPSARHNLNAAKPAHPAVKTPGSVTSAPEMPNAVATSPAPLEPQISLASPKAPRNLNPARPAQPSLKVPGGVPAPQVYHLAPATPAIPAVPSAPGIPRHIIAPNPGHPVLKAPRDIVSAPPVFRPDPAAPSIRFASPVAPANTSVISPSRIVTVQPGDSLWKIAEQHLGNGVRWHELLSVNPGISDPSRIIAGSQLVLPVSDSAHRAAKYTVQKGDSLWSIAQSHLGRATAWSCVAKANPEIADANFILEGQVISLPVSCAR